MNKELKVKVGDTVLCYSGASWRNEIPVIAEVIKVTPTGRIRISHSPTVQYDKYGNRMGGDCWSRPYIEVPTEERLQEVKEKRFIRRTIYKMRECKEDSLSYEQAKVIMGILKGK